MKIKQMIQLFVGVVLSVAMLWYIFKDMTLAEMVSSFESVRYIWLVPCLGVFYFGMWLRGVRWSWLFLPNHRVPIARATGGMFICFAFNSVFGMRLGEFARAYLVGKRDKTGFSTAFGTVVAERLLDGVTLLGCLIVALAIVPIPPEKVYSDTIFGRPVRLTGEMFIQIEHATIVGCAVLLVAILALSVARSRAMLLRAMHAIRFIPKGLRDRMENLIHKFAEGLASFHSPGRVVNLLLLSLAIWVTTAASAMFLAWGFDFQKQMTLSQAFTMVVIVCVPIALIPTPGYWGPYELGVIFAVSIMTIHPADALVKSYAVLLHLTQYIPIVAIGLPWAWFSHISLGEVKEAGKSPAADAAAGAPTS